MKTEIEKAGLAHLVYHNQHWSYCWGYQERVDYILKYKPLEEQETRLRWLVVIPPEMTPGIFSPEWKACVKAGEAYGKAWKAYGKAWETCAKAGEACVKAGESYGKACETYGKAWKAYGKAGEACAKARKAYGKARKAYTSKFAKELEALHKEMFSNCPWDGRTMFPKKE